MQPSNLTKQRLHESSIISDKQPANGIETVIWPGEQFESAFRNCRSRNLAESHDPSAGLNRNALIDYPSGTITKRDGKAASTLHLLGGFPEAADTCHNFINLVHDPSHHGPRPAQARPGTTMTLYHVQTRMYRFAQSCPGGQDSSLRCLESRCTYWYVPVHTSTYDREILVLPCTVLYQYVLVRTSMYRFAQSCPGVVQDHDSRLGCKPYFLNSFEMLLDIEDGGSP
jgi:hypothetical protein